ncbi:hypothetical protein [Thiohalomonas denitrificans]|uniref:hypothetical protein n=1 Tax=Thiohalomonas denitrificans TaxID=415747 RepID=UPI0026ECFB53|nr:hypothetical protein [Thiohalomonas denitrificans]
MAMNVMVVDAGYLAGEVDFPALEADRFGWSQYGETPVAEVPERCWRSHIVVTAATPLDAATLDAMPKLKMVAVAGGECTHIDIEAAQSRGVAVCHVPETNPEMPADAERICRETVANIDAFLRGEERNRVC